MEGKFIDLFDLVNPFLLSVYCLKSELENVERKYYPSDAAREREIVETFTRPSHYSQTYDAFETDIAVLYVYFGQPTTTEYIRKRGIFCVK